MQGLPKETVPLKLRKLSQKEPPQSGVDGSLDILQNMIAVKGAGDGTFEFLPRPGTDAVSTTVDVGSITTGVRLATLGNQLVLFTGNTCYRRAIDGWHRVEATFPVIGVQTTPIISNSLQTTTVDTAYVNGYRLAAAIVATVGAGVYDLVVSLSDSNGVQVWNTRLVTATVIGSVRIAVSGTAALVFWQQTNTNLYMAKFDSATPAVMGAATLVTATSAFVFNIDAQAVAATGKVTVLYTETSDSRRHQIPITVSSLAIGASVDTGIAGFPVVGYLVNDWATNVVYIGWVDTTNGLKVTTTDGTTLAPTGTTVYDATLVSAINIAGNRAGAAVNVYVTTSVDGTSLPSEPGYDHRIAVSTGAAATTVVRGMHLASKTISANGTLYALARYRGVGQGSMILLDLVAKVPVGRALPNIGWTGDEPSHYALPGLATAGSANIWLTAAIKNLADVTTGSVLTSYTGAVAVAFTFLDATVGRAVELNGGLHIPGALPALYDGGTITEDGFLLAPEQSDTPTVDNTGSLTASSTYTYRFVYAWTDAAGNVHRSPPTIVAQQVVLGVSQTAVTLFIPMLRLTRKRNVSIEVYRTLANGDGSQYFLVSPTAVPLINDPTVDRYTWKDTVSDVTAGSGLPIYTEGNVLDNLAPAPCKSYAVHKGRLLAAGIDGDPQAVWFSKDVSLGFGIAWNDGLVSRLAALSDPVTAIASMDAFAVACTQGGSTWASGDEYPDDVGVGGVLRYQQYSASSGVTATGLIARSEKGLVMWAGVKGAWLASRGVDWAYVGQDIEDDATTFTALAAWAVPLQNQIRILGSRGGQSTVFVFESIFGTWARWTYTQQATVIVDAVVWNGTAAYLCADGSVMTENTAKYDDLATPASVPHVCRLSAVDWAGVNTYKRLYISQPVGRVLGTGGMTIRADQTIDGVALAQKTKVIGGAETVLTLEVDPGTAGKCSSYVLTISDSGNGANTAFSLTDVTFVVGVKKGPNRLGAARRMT